MIEHPSILTNTELAMWEEAWNLVSGECAKRYTAPLIDPPGTQDISVVRFTSRSNIEYQLIIREMFYEGSFSQSLLLCEKNRIVFDQSVSGGEIANQNFKTLMTSNEPNLGDTSHDSDIRFDEDYLGLFMMSTRNSDFTLSSEQVLLLLLLPAKITKL